MKGNLPKYKGKATRGTAPERVVIDFVTTCPKCGGEIGLWSGALETICLFCSYRVFDKESTTH